MTADATSPAQWFAEEWAAMLGTVLESLAGERPQLSCRQDTEGGTASGEGAVPQSAELWWWEQHFPLPGEPSIWVGAPRAAWSQLAGRVLGSDGVEDDSQSRETYAEILQQSFSELARSAGRRWNRQIEAPGKEAPAAPPGGETYRVEAVFADGAVPPLLVIITGTPQDPSHEVVAMAEAAVPLGTQLQPQSRTFDLLMAVELPVSVSFGHVQLPLKEVLKLTAGSIIELNRTVDEPVEVIVNNCVVARGEVVVVEGNYGVRIHQIMSRRERLENLP